MSAAEASPAGRPVGDATRGGAARCAPPVPGDDRRLVAAAALRDAPDPRPTAEPGRDPGAGRRPGAAGRRAASVRSPRTGRRPGPHLGGHLERGLRRPHRADRRDGAVPAAGGRRAVRRHDRRRGQHRHAALPAHRAGGPHPAAGGQVPVAGGRGAHRGRRGGRHGLVVGGALLGLGPTTLLSGNQISLAEALGRVALAVLYVTAGPGRAGRHRPVRLDPHRAADRGDGHDDDHLERDVDHGRDPAAGLAGALAAGAPLVGVRRPVPRSGVLRT